MKRSLKYTKVYPDTKIWRYMNSKKFMDLIQSSHLYLRRIDKFEDPHEGYITEQFKTALSKNFEVLEKLDVDTRRQKENEFRAQALLPMYSYANCWYVDEHESDKMWQNYGKEKNSIAIQTTVKKLFDSIKYVDKGNNLYFEKIDYEDKSPSPNWLDIMFNKGKSYCFEKEFRLLSVMRTGIANLTYPYINNLPNVSDINNPHETYIDIDLENFIERIYISSNADQCFKDEIERELNQANCKFIECSYSKL